MLFIASAMVIAHSATACVGASGVLALLATSLPDPRAMPISIAFRAGESFTPPEYTRTFYPLVRTLV